MSKVNIKPMSVNQVWQGKRFKTPSYKKYRADLQAILPCIIIPDGELSVQYLFGVSNMGSDVDNLVKPFQDALQEKYGFNDSKIIEFKASKVKVKKGDEFIKFHIEKFKPTKLIGLLGDFNFSITKMFEGSELIIYENKDLPQFTMQISTNLFKFLKEDKQDD